MDGDKLVVGCEELVPSSRRRTARFALFLLAPMIVWGLVAAAFLPFPWWARLGSALTSLVFTLLVVVHPRRGTIEARGGEIVFGASYPFVRKELRVRREDVANVAIVASTPQLSWNLFPESYGYDLRVNMRDGRTFALLTHLVREDLVAPLARVEALLARAPAQIRVEDAGPAGYRAPARTRERVTYGAIRHRGSLALLAIALLLVPIAAIVAWLALGGSISGSVFIPAILGAFMIARARSGFVEHDESAGELVVGVERLLTSKRMRIPRADVTGVEIVPNDKATEWKLVLRMKDGKTKLLWTRDSAKELEATYAEISRILAERPPTRVLVPVMPEVGDEIPIDVAPSVRQKKGE